MCDAMKCEKIQIVTSFLPDPEILLNLGPTIKKLQNTMKAQLVQTPVANTVPLEVPRIVIKSSNVMVNIALNRIDIICKPPKEVSSAFDRAMKFAEEQGFEIIELIKPVLPLHKWTGVICTTQYPNSKDSKTESLGKIFDRLLSVQRKEKDISSFLLQFSYKQQEINKTINVSGYEKKQYALPLNKQAGPISINVDELPTIESGIQLNLDYNNKPQKKLNDPITSFQDISYKLQNDYTSILSELSLEDINT